MRLTLICEVRCETNTICEMIMRLTLYVRGDDHETNTIREVR